LRCKHAWVLRHLEPLGLGHGLTRSCRLLLCVEKADNVLCLAFIDNDILLQLANEDFIVEVNDIVAWTLGIFSKKALLPHQGNLSDIAKQSLVGRNDGVEVNLRASTDLDDGIESTHNNLVNVAVNQEKRLTANDALNSCPNHLSELDLDIETFSELHRDVSSLL